MFVNPNNLFHDIFTFCEDLIPNSIEAALFKLIHHLLGTQAKMVALPLTQRTSVS